MIDVDVPDGPGSPLVRGLAACLSSVTETALIELPDVGDASVEHPIAAWKSWLAGRGSGLVPIADPRSFQSAGWWIAVTDTQAGQAALLAFGTPPGVVLSPQDPSLLGRATPELDISMAWAVASLDPVLPPPTAGAALRGVVELLAVARVAGAPMRLVPSVRALAGRGLEGDRYADGTGTSSSRGARRPGFDLALIAAEVVEEPTARDAALDFASTRRNRARSAPAAHPSWRRTRRDRQRRRSGRGEHDQHLSLPGPSTSPTGPGRPVRRTGDRCWPSRTGAPGR